MQVPRSPNAEDRADIKAEFKLDDVQEARLWEVVGRVVEECTRHASFEQTESSREKRNKALNNLQRDVERLKKTFELSAPVLRELLRKTTYADLGGLFTSDALDEIAQQWVGPELEFRIFQKAVKVRRGMFNPADVDRLTIAERRELGKIYGQRLVDSLLTAISKPVSAQIAVESTNHGGRPQELYRNYLIQELGRSYSVIFGKKPTTTKTGAFVEFCERLIETVGLDPTGTEKAVPRVLKKADLIAASARKQSR